MKKLLLTAFAVASLAMTFTSCKKDVSEEELLKNQLAQADSLLKRGGVIKYTVKVVSTANSSMLKSKMSIENASVTVYQNDKVFTGQTDAMGFVTFPDMRVGTVAVNVTLKDHAEVDYIADITPQEQLTNISQSQVVNTIRYASTMVPMFPIADPGCATITGKVTAELDLTNTTPEPAEGVKVTATVDVDDPDFVARYIAPTQGTSSSPSAGRLLKYAFNDASVTATTAADGTYTLKVPASVNGLPVKLSVADYQTTQKLYMENNPTTNTFAPGEYTVPVLFSSNVEPSPIPEVRPLYIIIDEPTCPYGRTITAATFSFQVDAAGTITKVSLLNKGNFTNKPSIVAIYNGTGAILDPVFNSKTGSIDSVIIVNGGLGYKADGAGSFIRAFLTQERRIAKITGEISPSGYLSKITLYDKGIGYINNPSSTIFSIKRTAEKPTLFLECNPFNKEINTISITNPGNNLYSLGNYPSTVSTCIASKKIDLTINSTFTQNIFLGTGQKTN